MHDRLCVEAQRSGDSVSELIRQGIYRELVRRAHQAHGKTDVELGAMPGQHQLAMGARTV